MSIEVAHACNQEAIDLLHVVLVHSPRHKIQLLLQNQSNYSTSGTGNMFILGHQKLRSNNEMQSRHARNDKSPQFTHDSCLPYVPALDRS